MYERYTVFFEAINKNYGCAEHPFDDDGYVWNWAEPKTLLELCDNDHDKCRDYIFSVMDDSLWDCTSIVIPDRFQFCDNRYIRGKDADYKFRIIVRGPECNYIASSSVYVKDKHESVAIDECGALSQELQLADWCAAQRLAAQ